MSFRNVLSYIVFVFAIMMNVSCSQKKDIKDNLQGYLGKKIVLIDSLKSYTTSAGLNFQSYNLNNKLSIVTYIDASCGSCVQLLSRWKDLLDSPEFAKVNILFFVRTYNFSQLQLMLDDLEFNYPVIIDQSNVFFVKNNLDEEQKHFQTFLLDNQERIVLVGNPTLDMGIKDLYVRTISEMK